MLLSGKFSEKLEFNYNLNVEVKWKLVIRQIDRQTLTGSYRPKTMVLSHLQDSYVSY